MKINKLAVSAVAVFFAVSAVAAQTPDFDWYVAGPGEIKSIYTISTADELAGLAEIVNGSNRLSTIDSFFGKTITLTADIDLSEYDNWTPIGIPMEHPLYKASSPPVVILPGMFRGKFDGGGHVIRNLTINRNASFQGLFGYIQDAEVKNLGLENISISVGANVAGGIAGAADWSLIANCYTTGAVGGLSRIGGIVGVLTGGTVSNCYSAAGVDGFDHVGGIVGLSIEGLVRNSAALNPYVESISGDNGALGRVAGWASHRPLPDDYTMQLFSNNVAYAQMGGVWVNIGADKRDGQGIGIDGINMVPDLFGLFLPESGWALQSGKLPGLNGNPVEMPEHLRINASVKRPAHRQPAGAQFVTVSGRTLNLRLAERGSVGIYALNGARVRTFDLSGGTHTLRLNDLPRGVYAVRAKSGAWKQSARVVVK